MSRVTMQARRMFGVANEAGEIRQVLSQNLEDAVRLPEGWHAAPVMVISIAEYMRLKAAATRKGRK